MKLNKQIPILKSDKITLRKLVDADLVNIYKGLSNPKVIQHYGISYDSLEATKEQMVWFKKKEQMWWAICSLDNQIFYGAGGLNDIDDKQSKAEIGLWLLPEFWGMGIMKEAMPVINDYAFNQLNLNRIEGYVEIDNINCKKAMAKLDFQLENTMKDCEVKNGRLISLDLYVKTRKE